MERSSPPHSNLAPWPPPQPHVHQRIHLPAPIRIGSTPSFAAFLRIQRRADFPSITHSKGLVLCLDFTCTRLSLPPFHDPRGIRIGDKTAWGFRLPSLHQRKKPSQAYGSFRVMSRGKKQCKYNSCPCHRFVELFLWFLTQ